MKNIDVYPNTKDALEEWNRAKPFCGTDMDFQQWLGREYPMREPTLLEAAENAVTAWHMADGHIKIDRQMKALSSAIASEKRKPIRNCDRYRTAEEAWRAFNYMCDLVTCDTCQFAKEGSCRINWLYAEAEKEEEKR